MANAKSPISSTRLNKLSGEISTPFDNKTLWDKRYSKRSYVYGKSPAKFLAENFDYLKPESNILDMGMGEGRNAVFLAQKGHKVTGIDISSVAIKKSQILAKEFGVKIKTVVGTLNKYKIKDQTFDVIICFYFVDRDLNEKIKKWLKPGGILIYEAHTLNEYNLKNSKGDNKNYYLKPQELLSMFPQMKILKYEEPLHESEYRAGIILKKKD
ncbi:MAG: 2-polyprenyl-3-methyl-5-hydroxy-6-metoxy-1,4-benzoquinol methylase [Bacteriovoracaceae bacterium]|jgi:2-polyprenyl-3-methyl-5-hydroxy-6-metoxy-1,4-benzoquinol methylase